MSISDRLAVDRTSLANTRTLLAYLRTSLGCLALGFSLHHFFGSRFAAVGYGFILAAFVLGLIGVVQYRAFRRRIAKFLLPESH
jgi:putative membrane protein